MERQIIIESNQELAKKNYYVDYGTAINDDVNTTEFSNSKWKTKLPQGIPLEVGDSISYYGSMIKSKGLSDEGVELIGSANSNELLTDNKARLKLGYYISNNWQNNLVLPKSLASLRDWTELITTAQATKRNFDFENTYNTYNVPMYDGSTYTQIPRVWWSDYGGPSIELHTEWIQNGPYSTQFQANKIDNHTSYKFSNANPTATGHLMNYVPDDQRLYIGPADWIGPYGNGWNSYHNLAYTRPYSKFFDIITSNADIETNLGFNSPVVIGQKITESMNDPNFADNVFVKPQIIDYKDLTHNPAITEYKNYFKTYDTTQVIDETCKALPTSFGKVLYDLNNGVDNFSLNDDVRAATGGTNADIEQRARYFWNSMASGDYKRTQAINLLYQNLYLSKNALGIQLQNPFTNVCIYTGADRPNVNWSSHSPESNGAYPTTHPYDIGEQIVIADDLTNFAVNYTADDLTDPINRILFRDFTANSAGYETGGFKVPALTDKKLALVENNVIMTNLVANDMNFNMLKSVIDLLEKPSSNTIDIDYKNQEFLDSLYFSFEVGNLDDNYSQSIFNIENSVASKEYTLPRVENGISVPVALANVHNITSNAHPWTSSTPLGYTETKGFWRLPLLAGLFADRENIKDHTEGTSPIKYITKLEEWRSNKMYEIDFFSRYNTTRTPKAGNLVLPDPGRAESKPGHIGQYEFTDPDGNYFDDSKIKELGLGCVVAFKQVDASITIVPFIGFVCRTQISSVGKYNIPLPTFGEFFGIPRSLQNNMLSYTTSNQRKVEYDDRGVVLADIDVKNGGFYESSVATLITAEIAGITATTIPTISLQIEQVFIGLINHQRIIEATITNNGKRLEGNPVLTFKQGSTYLASKDFDIYPEIELVIGDFKNSYNAGTIINNQPNYPYVMVGANDITCSFDETQSRMGISKMHTLMKEGQESNNLQRYYNASMVFNTSIPVITPDSQSANDVIKMNVRKTYCNSARAGFTEGIPKEDPNKQIIPIVNNAIRSKGILSAISGIGLLELWVAKKDDTYLKVNVNNPNTYKGTLFDKLGFNMNQLLPKFGTQSKFFNRGTHNKYVNTKNEAVLLYNNAVKPLSTNAFVSSNLNQSINTNNLNYLMGGIDGNNLLEKSSSQTTDSLIAMNLPQKFSYSHILIYSNIIPKYNYIAGPSINNTPCIGSINRSYEVGDWIYGNQQGIPYIVDKKYVLTDIDIDLRTETGLEAPINDGSTIILKINKRKPIPLEEKEN